ncbi:hypothetical protein [Actinomadura atramentaria]|uniref:hypothetical protein n=1 Tax=Actinomadura atramentaria TaxID=1990 RepID=UPI00037BF0C0|nr:hypothetical protein [Actinomadura atramentaria]
MRLDGSGADGLFDVLARTVEATLAAAPADAGADAAMAAPGARAMMGSAVAAIEWWLHADPGTPRAVLVGYPADLAWNGGRALPGDWLGFGGA